MSHTEGIHKDLMTLLHEEESYLKVYFARDTTKHRMRIDEVISEYKKNSQTRALLKGLRIIYLPGEFDADKLSEQKLMSGLMSHLVEIIKSLLFPIDSSGQFNYLKEIKESALYSANNFGRKLTVSAQSEDTKFYKTFNWDDWREQILMMPELKDKLFTEPDFDYVY